MRYTEERILLKNLPISVSPYVKTICENAAAFTDLHQDYFIIDSHTTTKFYYSGPKPPISPFVAELLSEMLHQIVKLCDSESESFTAEPRKVMPPMLESQVTKSFSENSFDRSLRLAKRRQR